MEFGVSLPSRGATTTTDNLRLLAQHAETVGLDSIWGERSHHRAAADRVVLPVRPERRLPRRAGAGLLRAR